MWILLLDVRDISASSYINLVELGPSTSDDQIRNDAFRTMATDANFLERVSEDMLIRLLNALVWKKERGRWTLGHMVFITHKSIHLSYRKYT